MERVYVGGQSVSGAAMNSVPMLVRCAVHQAPSDLLHPLYCRGCGRIYDTTVTSHGLCCLCAIHADERSLGDE
jgi:hypothetical protein